MTHYKTARCIANMNFVVRAPRAQMIGTCGNLHDRFIGIFASGRTSKKHPRQQKTSKTTRQARLRDIASMLCMRNRKSWDINLIYLLAMQRRIHVSIFMNMPSKVVTKILRYYMVIKVSIQRNLHCER